MKEKSIYERWFAIRPVITPGFPWNTPTGGGYLSPEVIEAMNEAAKHKVHMTELLEQAGEVIADIIGAEAVFITSSDCAAMTLGAAAMMTGKDPKKMNQLPDTEYPIRLKNELITQIGMCEYYMNSFRVTGGKLVRVGGREFDYCRDYDPVAIKTKARGIMISPEEIEEAITERTAGIIAAVHCSASVPPPGTVPVEEVVKIAKKHNIPTIIDAPHVPVAGGERGRAFLRKYLDMGVDLVTAGGSKAIDGPNDTGIIYGKKELVETAALQGAPGKGAAKRYINLGIEIKAGFVEAAPLGRTPIGRGYKVSREQIVGFVAALKRYVAMDSEAITARDTKVCQWMADQFKDFPNVRPVGVVPEADWPNDNMFEGGPSCILEIDEKALGIKIRGLPRLMWEGNPHVDITPSNLMLSPWSKLQLFGHGLRDGEEEIVVKRLKKILTPVNKRVIH
jgi:L-seryl-tRNA(Ser) seleniumtransferase